MSTLTPNLNLFKIIPSEDAKKAFNFYEILNDNWDKLDNAYSSQLRNIQELMNLMYNTVYRIGQPIIRLDNYLAENEVRLEGEEKLIDEYPLLYEVYGNTYGEARTGYFKLPDCRNRVFWGSKTFGYVEAGLPNITGRFSSVGQYDNGVPNTVAGAFYRYATNKPAEGTKVSNGSDAARDDVFGFDASRKDATKSQANGIYRNDCFTVQPPALKVRVVTRYR